jgi:hypothetical protein
MANQTVIRICTDLKAHCDRECEYEQETHLPAAQERAEESQLLVSDDVSADKKKDSADLIHAA